MTRRTRWFSYAVPLAIVVLGVTVALTAGCSAQSVKDAAAPAAQPLPVTRMEPADARALIDTNFPAEVPVAQGDIVSGKAQGTDAWDYEVHVAASVDAVTAWYLSEYERRTWELADRQTAGGVTRLTLRKGGAESQVSVRKSPTDGSTVVNVILGVGAPVLETQ